MQRLQAYEYELLLGGQQKRGTSRFAGSCRFVYNKALALQKATTAISQNHAMVCIEDLQVRNMSKSAAGASEAPGRNVRAKAGSSLGGSCSTSWIGAAGC